MVLYFGATELTSGILGALQPRWALLLIIFGTGALLLFLCLMQFWACLMESRCGILLVLFSFLSLVRNRRDSGVHSFPGFLYRCFLV